MTTEDIAVRVAEIVSAVMNLSAAVHDEGALQTIDPGELRAELLSIADELTWLGAIVASGSTVGISWPQNARERIERFRAALTAWDAAGPPTVDVVTASRDCLAIIQPSTG